MKKNLLQPSLLAGLLCAALVHPALAALKEGDAAPDFQAGAALAGKAYTYSLKDALSQGPVVVYFYPSAYTGGCNLQARAFAENVEQFAAAGATIVGVSLDSIQRLKDFSADPQYCAGKIPVASDRDGRIARAYDLAITQAQAGRKDTRGQEIDHDRVERTTFVVTPDSKVAATIGGVAPDANVQGALNAVRRIAATTRTPAIPGVVTGGTPIEFIKDGFKGTEGPLGLADGSLLFTETQDKRITRIAPDGSTSAFLENSNGANGLGLNPAGELVAVQVDDTRVGVVHPVERARTLADSFEGRRFGRPNDLVVAKDGTVYFTDSGVNRQPGQPAPAADLAQPAVYRITTQGELQRLAADIERPNGIQLSPDERVLYVANTGGEHVLAFDIAADGTVGPRRDFARLAGFRQTDNGPSSGADGLAVDALGRVYVASTAGIQVFDDKGAALGVVTLPKAPQNLAFAGRDKRTLYVVGRGGAWRIATLTPGHAGRAK